MTDQSIVEIEVAVAVVFDGPRMLVCKRPQAGYYGGWWEWPGGKLDHGENPEACARRELMEEIGLEAGPLRRFYSMNADYPGRRVKLTFFVGEVLAGQRPRNDALEHRWLKPHEARDLKFLEANLPVLEKLITELAQ